MAERLEFDLGGSGTGIPEGHVRVIVEQESIVFSAGGDRAMLIGAEAVMAASGSFPSKESADSALTPDSDDEPLIIRGEN
jgi:hypothetical protein